MKSKHFVKFNLCPEEGFIIQFTCDLHGPAADGIPPCRDLRIVSEDRDNAAEGVLECEYLVWFAQEPYEEILANYIGPKVKPHIGQVEISWREGDEGYVCVWQYRNYRQRGDS